MASLGQEEPRGTGGPTLLTSSRALSGGSARPAEAALEVGGIVADSMEGIDDEFAPGRLRSAASGPLDLSTDINGEAWESVTPVGDGLREPRMVPSTATMG